MIIDGNVRLAGSIVNGVQTPFTTSNAATQTSDLSVDLGSVTGDQIGSGEPIQVVIHIGLALAAGTVSFNLISSASDTLSNAVSAGASTGEIAAADCGLGKVFSLTVPARVAKTGLRYLGIQTVKSTGADDLAYSAYVVTGVQTN